MRYLPSMSLAGIVCALGFASAFTASAEQAKENPKVDPTLLPDPQVVKIIDELGDNSSAVLTNLKTVGEWNDVTKEYGMEPARGQRAVITPTRQCGCPTASGPSSAEPIAALPPPAERRLGVRPALPYLGDAFCS